MFLYLQIRMGKGTDGLDMTALREIKLLRELCSVSAGDDELGNRFIVLLIDVYQRKHNVHLVVRTRQVNNKCRWAGLLNIAFLSSFFFFSSSPSSSS